VLTASLALHARPRAGLVCAKLELDLKKGLYTPPPVPVPPIAVLADKQELATILASNWAEAAGSTGGFSGDTVEVGPSAVHGLGLIALRDIEEGTVVTLYPVHRVLQSLGNGRGAACLADEDGDDYFRPSEPISDKETAYRQTAYRQTYNHPDPARPESFMLDADPTKLDINGWLGHRVNDGAILAPGSTSDEEVLRYYEESTARRNLCAVALCVPLLGFVTTCAVSKGSELFATYGHSYWLQEDLPCSEAVEEALRMPAMEVCMQQIAVDKKYGKAIIALDQFLMDASPDDATQLLDKLDLTDASSRTETTTTTTTTTTTARDSVPVVSEPPQGFGQAKRKPKGNASTV